ncbi:MAG TPA: hypothetical protein VFX57_05550 [Sulfuricurvum sp.]|nr:hypothetical protein [Sulfuricurvum sp.]
MINPMYYMALAATTIALAASGCAQKQLTVNGMICPEGYSEERVKADFSACRYYNLKDADKASYPVLTDECKECLEKKGYTIEK